MSRLTDYLALFLAVAIVFLLVRGPIDFRGLSDADALTEATMAEEDALQEVTADFRPAAARVDIEVDLATADITAGADLYQRQCRACHSTKPSGTGAGPSLYGIVNSPAGAVAGFAYSDAMAGSEIVWTPGALAGYLVDPRDYLPGTSMAFVGLSDVQDAVNVIAYLEAISVN